MPFPLTVINISILVLVLVALISLILLLRNYLSREKVLVYYPEHDPLNLNPIDDTNFSEFGDVSSSEDFNSSRKLNKKANKKNKKNKKMKKTKTRNTLVFSYVKRTIFAAQPVIKN